jgi:hypothetical protein
VRTSPASRVDHLALRIIGNINKCTAQSRF